MDIQISEKIRLELTAVKHVVPLLDVIDNNRDHLSEFLPWVGEMQTAEDLKSYLKNCEMLYRQEKEVSFVIFFNEVLVGRIGLNHLDSQNRMGAIGYWLSKNAQGQGIILRSCKWIINYGFKDLNLQRIELKAAVENVKSRAIPVKLNFKEEGILRHAELVNNRFIDLVLYSILKDEWKNNEWHFVLHKE
ncbi:MAG: GNAT family protein [Ginsengibacter sp.]